MGQIDTSYGFTLSDGAALVMGSAVGSLHMIGVRHWDLSGSVWIMIVVSFALVSLTATGPFIFVSRRFLYRVSNYPQVGDRLWAILGLPWLLTALVQSAWPTSEPRQNPLVALTLSVGLAIACLISLAVVWNTWVMVPPAEAKRIESAPWTSRVGLFLSIAWPVQCGLGMVVLS